MSLRRVLFIDRDGALIVAPADRQVDDLRAFQLVSGVIPALCALRDAGYTFVMLSHQDGPGTANSPETVRGPHELLRGILGSQGITFEAELICSHLPTDGCNCHTPGVGLIDAWLREHPIDAASSHVIGDRDSDMRLAQKLGIAGLRLDGSQGNTWPDIARRLAQIHRTAQVERRTKETRIEVGVDLDQEGPIEVSTGLGFFDHMLEQVAKHGGFSLRLSCRGDLHIDEHHTVEDCALALGQALRAALGDKRGIQRYGFLLPMDESLAQVAIDLSGRPYFVFEGRFTREQVGQLPTELVPHFFRSLAESLGAAINIKVTGENTHHMIEGCFKGVGRALRQALRVNATELPSTKGVL